MAYTTRMATLNQLAELERRLESLDQAIEAAQNSNSYSIGGRTFTAQDLPSLRDERTRLVREIKQTRAVLEGARSPGEAVASWYR